MCLYPLTIRNPTKVINNRGGQLLRMQVPCGICAQCLQAKRNGWYIRTHYEIKRTHSLGGYVYFDTLTYNDENLPKLSHFVDIEKYDLLDFSCFNLQHFKAFMKRLRRRIAYHYGVKKDAFRYFLTSEYGEDDRFTHRPHYHVLFFVYAPIPPLEFSQLVADCWQYGRTDGFPYKPACYVNEHIYTKESDFKSTESVAMYVSKYITKSSTFTKKLAKRIDFIRQQMTRYNALNNPTIDDDSVEFIKSLRSNIDMFHRQSQGFGLSYLDNMTPDKLMFAKKDKVIMQDSEKIVKTYPMPMYYMRKLYYNLKKHPDGTRYWELTEYGVTHVLNAKLAKVDAISSKYMDIVRNCSNDELVDKFFKLLADRDISDYVVYEQFYKGRHRDINSINYKLQTSNSLTYEENNLNDWLSSMRHSLCPYLDSDYSLQVDEKLLRAPILSPAEVAQMETEFLKHGHPVELLNNSHSDLIDDYIHRYTFNENSDIIFRDFDKISVLITMMSEEQRDDAQQTFEFLEELKSRYKYLFNLNL